MSVQRAINITSINLEFCFQKDAWEVRKIRKKAGNRQTMRGNRQSHEDTYWLLTNRAIVLKRRINC